jgi:hypothetical protein
MNRLLHLQDKLLQNSQALARLESEVALRPDSRTLQSNILSLRKLHYNLKHEFDEVANDLGLDVCHYRMLQDRPPAKALTSAIGAFQDALALAYDALRTGIPKSRRKFTPDAVADTELRVAYSYPGSFGVAFTISNERLLLPEMQTNLDRAAATVFEVGKAADNIAIVSKTVKEIGRGPLVAIYDWAKANVEYKTGAAIEWRKSERDSRDVLIQLPEFDALYTSLDKIRETKDEEIVETGSLVGADIKSRRFHFVVDDSDKDIRGKFIDAISESQKAELPRRYIARLHKTTEISYATDEEKESYVLLELQKIPTR